MREDMLHDRLLQALRQKISNHTLLSNTLTDILYIEKEAVYRRLRGEVPFTLAEAATISTVLGFSLDYLAGSQTGDSKPFTLSFRELDDPLSDDFTRLSALTDILATARSKGETVEAGVATNLLPQGVMLKYSYVQRFYLFKWLYLYGNNNPPRTFAEVNCSDKLAQIYRDFVFETEHLESTSYIFDHMIFQYLVDDIKYFASIRLISKEDVQSIKNDLIAMLDFLEGIATRGTYGHTGKKVSLYVSNINFDTGYSYVQTGVYKISLIAAYTLTAVISIDEAMFNRNKTWMNSLKRLSTLISESGEVQRILFFEQQRELVNSL